jgi:iron(III) transport system permease protein
METLSDFGAVSFFGINTLTTGIYNSWIAFDDLAFANQLSFYLLIFILALFILENFSRKKAKYHSPTKGGFKQKEKISLSGMKSSMAFSFCSLILLLSFLFPLSQMLYWTIIFPKNFFDLNFQQLFINTMILVSLSCLSLIVFSFLSNYGNRVSRSKFLNFLTTFSVSGYAIPGVILAVAFITFIAWFDNTVVNFFELKSIKRIFIGSILGLVLVYFIRFYSLASNGIKSGYEKINRSIDESAYLIGYSKLKTFLNIHVPYLRNSVLLIAILISLEIIRELPITLILRPFNFETFATTAYIFASQDLLEAAAVPSLFLIIIASFFILLTSKYILRDRDE